MISIISKTFTDDKEYDINVIQDKETLDREVMTVVKKHIDITDPDWFDHTNQVTWANVFTDLEEKIGNYYFFFGWAPMKENARVTDDFKEGVGINNYMSRTSLPVWFYEIDARSEKNLKRIKLIDEMTNETRLE